MIDGVTEVAIIDAGVGLDTDRIIFGLSWVQGSTDDFLLRI